MKYTFEAYREDGSPRKFAGTHRPTYEEAFEIAKKSGMLYYYVRNYQCDITPEYNAGKFDKAIYEDD